MGKEAPKDRSHTHENAFAHSDGEKGRCRPLLTVISRISTIQAMGTKLQLLPESKVVVDSGSFGNCFSEKVERFRQFL